MSFSSRNAPSLDFSALDEMGIVDFFTQLIFDAEMALDETGQLLVDLLKQHDSSLQRASRRELSEYLRSMGVKEMITIVSAIKSSLEHSHILASCRHSARPFSR